jgi:carboxyl-terminal processing protease
VQKVAVERGVAGNIKRGEVDPAKPATKPGAEAPRSDQGDTALAQDDGLQPDERGISTDIAREKEAKEKRDIILDEAAHILADEIGLIRADTKLAAQVLPRGAIVPTEVN